jgi:hypothetical protein
VDYVTEDGISFMRITSLTPDGYAYAYSSKYPRNIVGTRGDYVVIRYRTSSSKGEDLGITFRTVQAPEYDLTMCYYDSVGTDGEWHTVIYYMTGEPGWDGANFILNMALVPFYDAEDFAQETFDVAWVKFYQNDPTDLFEADFYVPDDEPEETTEAPTDAATEAPTDVTEAPTDAPDAGTEAPTDAPVEKKGCGSVVGFGVVAVLTAMAAAVALQKKDE